MLQATNSTIRQRFFRVPLYAFAALVLLLAGFEVGLRLVGYGDDYRLFIPAPSEYGTRPQLMVNPKLAYPYFPKQQSVPGPASQMFARQKPDNGYRIFVLGSSTVSGWPYPRNVAFSTILQQRLSDAFPGKQIEVINMGITAINSFSLVDFMDEVLQQQPDAVIVYAGHNEFYGTLGAASTCRVGDSYLEKSGYLSTLKFKTTQLVRNLYGDLSHSAITDAWHQTDLVQHLASSEQISTDSDAFKQTVQEFRANITELVLRAKAAGVRVLLSELVSNLRDQAPFSALDGDEETAAERAYRQAKAFEQEGDYAAARQSYLAAKELDGTRYRAPEIFNNIIHQIAAAHRVPVVPMERYFEQASSNGIIGDNLMLEHLHPNVEGQFVMSNAFFDSMRDNGFISAAWRGNIKPADYYHRTWPVTDLDLALGELRIFYLGDERLHTISHEAHENLHNGLPDNLAESLALETFWGKISFLEGHMQMANYYEQQGLDELALREYHALVMEAPQNLDYHLAAIKALLKRNQFSHALPLLYRSLRIKQTAFANKWVGHIYMLQNRAPEEVLPHLEMAYALDPNDHQLVVDLMLANLARGDSTAATHYMNVLEKRQQTGDAEKPRRWLERHKT